MHTESLKCLQKPKSTLQRILPPPNPHPKSLARETLPHIENDLIASSRPPCPACKALCHEIFRAQHAIIVSQQNKPAKPIQEKPDFPVVFLERYPRANSTLPNTLSEGDPVWNACATPPFLSDRYVHVMLSWAETELVRRFKHVVAGANQGLIRCRRRRMRRRLGMLRS
jgi:hypothetical protein